MMGGSGGQGGQQAEGQQQQQQMQGPPAEYGEQQQSYQQEQQNPCQGFNMNFVNCLKQNSTDVGFCQQYMDMLQQCEKDAAMGRQNYQ